MSDSCKSLRNFDSKKSRWLLAFVAAFGFSACSLGSSGETSSVRMSFAGLLSENSDSFQALAAADFKERKIVEVRVRVTGEDMDPMFVVATAEAPELDLEIPRGLNRVFDVVAIGDFAGSDSPYDFFVGRANADMDQDEVDVAVRLSKDPVVSQTIQIQIVASALEDLATPEIVLQVGRQGRSYPLTATFGTRIPLAGPILEVGFPVHKLLDDTTATQMFKTYEMVVLRRDGKRLGRISLRDLMDNGAFSNGAVQKLVLDQSINASSFGGAVLNLKTLKESDRFQASLS